MTALPYKDQTVAAIVHDYVVNRGDLFEQYALDQLVDLIEQKIAHARREGGCAEGRAEMYHELWAYWHETGRTYMTEELDQAFRDIQDGAPQ